MEFRKRDGVCIEYEVRGISGSEKFPYVNNIPTLKEAVAIARTYPGVYGDGAATHVIRRRSRMLPNGHQYRSGYTHRWRVDSNGRMQLIIYYTREGIERNTSSTCRVDLQTYKAMLPVMPNKASTLQGELTDLSRIAEKIGLIEAGNALREHVYGWKSLPNFREERIESPTNTLPVSTLNDDAPKSFWLRIFEKHAMTRKVAIMYRSWLQRPLLNNER